MTFATFNIISIAVLFHCFVFTMAAEQYIGSDLINRTFTFEDAKRVFIDVHPQHRLPNGGKLVGFAMYIRPIPNFQRDHYARFCIWTKIPNRDKTTFKLKYQTAARFPKQLGIYTTRIDDDVFTTDLDYFGVTYEQETGTITREVDANGKLMFSDVYDNLPNTNDEIVIIQENYLNVMSMQAIIDDGTSVACNSGYSRDSNGNCLDINECLNNNGGCDQNCNNNEGSFTCSCRSGFSLQSNGRSCQSNDQCSNSGCQHRCVNTGNSYYCECFNGYTLDSNGRTCNDINECLNNNGGCDQNCNNNEGSFTCSCRSGFSLQSNGRSCQSNDQCSNSGCQHRCVNTGNSYYCECFNGYTLDSNGRTCNDINECLNNNGGCDQICNNNEGSFTCSCRSGFSLQSNGRSCQSDDQCSNSGCQHRCVNTGNSYYCECFNGYTLDNGNGKTCNNINECLNNNGGCDHNCNDNEGSFFCSCRSGFALESNARTCRETQAQYVTGPHGMTGATGPMGPQGQQGPPGAPGDIASDTNECPGGCQHSCINTFGSYYCECNKGYALNSNGRNCDNINECATNNGMCQHSCDDRQGTYICSCKSGYRLSPNNHNCQDIDECEEKKPCGTETCVNTIGGYRCVELRFLNDVSGYQDEPRIAEASVSVPFAEQSKQISEKDSIVENNDADLSTDIRVVIWLGALSVLMALLVGANFLFCRKRSSEERRRLTESTTEHSFTDHSVTDYSITDHSVTELELEETHI